MFEKITSQHNGLIKHLVSLKKSTKRKKGGEFIIEGKKEIGVAMKAGVKLITLFLCSGMYKTDDLKAFPDVKVIDVSPSIFKKITFRENPDGFVAMAESYAARLENIKLGSHPLILVIESVEKPGNLGAMLRTVDAARVEAVIVADPRVDIFNSNVIRASLGAVFTTQIAVCSTEEAISWLKEKRINIYAATPEGAINYTKADFKKDSAIVIGTEHAGLSQDWLAAATEKIVIPMKGEMDSLNASVSAAVIVFEAVRQRME